MRKALRSWALLARYQLWKLESFRYAGTRFDCPICRGHFDAMKPFVGSCFLRGVETDHYTENAICPRCHSDIRQRFIAEFIKVRTDIFSNRQKVLHFAPELGIYKMLKYANLEYVAADLNPIRFAGATFADITNIPFPACFFDHVICIHVLEHIRDDYLAISEIYRVLDRGGHALLAVPTYGETTYEDRSLDHRGREMQYGAGDHLRLNGLDFACKLERVGFHVEIVSIDDVPGNYVDRSVQSPHTESDKYLFYCRK